MTSPSLPPRTPCSCGRAPGRQGRHHKTCAAFARTSPVPTIPMDVSAGQTAASGQPRPSLSTVFPRRWHCHRVAPRNCAARFSAELGSLMRQASSGVSGGWERLLLYPALVLRRGSRRSTAERLGLWLKGAYLSLIEDEELPHLPRQHFREPEGDFTVAGEFWPDAAHETNLEPHVLERAARLALSGACSKAASTGIRAETRRACPCPGRESHDRCPSLPRGEFF